MSKVASIHPDHLLDLARRGALPPDARQQLGAHLAVCRPCAWEQALRDDFEREQDFVEGASGLAPAALDGLVDGALMRGGLSVPTQPGLRPRRQIAGSRWGLAAAAVLATAIGAAMALPGRGPREGAPVEPPLAATEANLDAGALGAGVGGDS